MDLRCCDISRINSDKQNGISLILSKNKPFSDKIFKIIVVTSACYTLFLLFLVIFSVSEGSKDIFFKEGFDFLTGTDWNPVEGRESFGAFPYIIGTLLSSGIAMLIGVPVSLGIAIFISEISNSKIATPLSFVIELLAAVPSIIYGLWALFVFRFWIKDFIEKPLYDIFHGSLPLFAKTPFGLDIFTTGIVLSIMIIPIISSICREVLKSVPNSQREAAYALGATRWETIKTAVIPYAKSGIMGASILGLGRAVGETMLVTLIIGNVIGSAAIPTSLFSQGQTLASLIANEFNEASSDIHLSALIGLGVVLLLLTMIINIFAQLLVKKTTRVTN